MKRIILLLFALCRLTALAQPPQPEIKWVTAIGNDAPDEGISILPIGGGGFVSVCYITGNSTGYFPHAHNGSSNTDIGIIKYDGQKNVIWKKCIGSIEYESVTKIIEATNGDYIISSTTIGSTDDITNKQWGGEDIWLCRLDTSGTIKWSKTYGTNGSDVSVELINTLDGGLMIGGYSNVGDGDLDTVYNGNGWYDGYLIKLDSAGNKEWSRNYGGTNHDFMRAVVQGKDSMYYIAMDVESIDIDATQEGFALNGFPDTAIPPSWDFYVAKIDQQGNILWHYNYGGSWNEYMTGGLVYNDDNTLFIAGETQSDDYMASCNVFFDRDILLIKIDTSGKVLWSKCIGGSEVDNCFGLISNGNNGCVVYGRSRSSDGDIPFNFFNSAGGVPTDDAIAININPSSDIIWSSVVGGTRGDIFFGCSLQISGNIMCIGRTASYDGSINQPCDSIHGDVLIAELSKHPVSATNYYAISQSIICYPNPTTDMLHLKSTLPIKAQISLYDMTGRQILATQMQNDKIGIDLNRFQSGTYILTITDVEHKTHTTHKISKL